MLIQTRWRVARQFSPTCAGSKMSAVKPRVLFKMAEIFLATEESDVKIDLNPTFLMGETERGSKFWNKSIAEMKFKLERLWIRFVRALPSNEKPNYGMHNMDPVLEEITGNKLELVGPILDGYLQEIGQAIESKLSRSRMTGLATPIVLFIPYSIFKHLWVLVSGYGGDVQVQKNGDKITVEVKKMETAQKVWSVARFEGQSYLSKRKFEKIPQDGRMVFSYMGKSCVVITANTPLTIVYSMKNQRATVMFFIQRYDKNEFALDIALQKLLNS